MSVKYINTELSKKILVIGVKRDTPGGMAAVVNSYDRYFEQMKYITTWKVGNKLAKVLYVLYAFLIFLYKMLFDKQIKIIHIHAAANASFRRKSLFVHVGKFFGKKVILHMHAADFEEYYANSKNKMNILTTITKCDGLIVLSQSWREYFKKIGIPLDKIYVLNNVVSPPLMQYVHSQEDVFNLLFLGEIGKRKGVYDLLKVISENKSFFSGRMKLRVGGNLEEEIIKNYIFENNLSSIVSFEGWIKGDKKVECLNWADAYILPSYNEGLPIAILEAMSYSCPIVSTNVGGIPEIVKNEYNGFLIEPGNHGEIFDSLKKLVLNPDLVKIMGGNSYKMITPFFPENVFLHLKKIYNTLLL